MAQPNPMEVHEVQQSIARSLEVIAGSLSSIATALADMRPSLKAIANKLKD